MIVIYDDLDMPLGKIKISYGGGSGGHKGVESIARGIKTKDFIRLRVGISAATAKGVAKKPKGEEKVIKHLMSDFGKDKTLWRSGHTKLMAVSLPHFARALCPLAQSDSPTASNAQTLNK